MRWVEIVILHEYDYVNQVNKRAYSYVELFWYIWTSTKYLFAYFFLARCYVVAKV